MRAGTSRKKRSSPSSSKASESPPRTTPSWSRLGNGVAVALGAAILATFVLWYGARPLGASDIFWQVRTGELALETGKVPATDPFSYTIFGKRWNNHEWLFEILAALLQHALGWGAFRAMVLVLFGGVLLAVGWQVARRSGAAAGLLLAALALMLSAYKALPVPQLVSMAIFLAVWAGFRGRSLVQSPGPPAVLAVILLIWGNLTAEALTFLPFVVLDQLLLRRSTASPPALRPLAVALFIAALLAPLLNPPWASTLDYLWNGTAVNRTANAEFAHLWESGGAVDQTAKDIAIAIIALYLPWAGWTLVRSKDRWSAIHRCAPSLLAIAAGAEIQRDLWLLVLPASELVGELAIWAGSKRLATASSIAMVALALGLFAAWSPRGWSPASGLRDLGSRGYAENLSGALPLDCMAPVEAAPEGTRLYTLRPWASYVIWRAHGVRVFIDGRNLEYPLELYQAGGEVWQGGPQAEAVLDSSQTQMVLAYPGWNTRPGVQRSAWTELHRGAQCAVFQRAR